jgi:hypothetical protein
LKKTVSLFLIALALCGAATEAFAVTPAASRRGRKVRKSKRYFWQPVLRGSRESLYRQNEEIDRLGLQRVRDDQHLEQLVLASELVRLEDSRGMRVDPRLDPARRYARFWVRDFLADLGEAFYIQFGGTLQVNSAVRTIEQQRKLTRKNRNAAPAEGEIASSHLAGITVDLSKRGLSRAQKKWLVGYLKDLRDAGLIEAAEERRQAVFHIMVSERYANYREQRDVQATAAGGQ